MYAQNTASEKAQTLIKIVDQARKTGNRQPKTES